MDIHCGLFSNVGGFTVWGSEALHFESELKQNARIMCRDSKSRCPSSGGHC